MTHSILQVTITLRAYNSFAGIGLGNYPIKYLLEKVMDRPDAVLRWRDSDVLIIDEGK